MKSIPARSLFRIGVLMLSSILFVTVLVPTQPAEAQGYYHGSTPCPHYSIQDVLNDPATDWDGDGVGNSNELYNGLNPCHYGDVVEFCAGGGNPLCNYNTIVRAASPAFAACAAHVNAYPHGDYDGDGVSNTKEWPHADPCNKPCPGWTTTDLTLNPHGDWDGDGRTNSGEVYSGNSPCSSYVIHHATPCPSWTHHQVNYAPNHDWDGDGITNANEVRYGSSPCVWNRTKQLPVVTTYVAPKRLPHVSTTYVAPLPPPVCPVNYPYYHRGNGLCYANPVGYGKWH